MADAFSFQCLWSWPSSSLQMITSSFSNYSWKQNKKKKEKYINQFAHLRYLPNKAMCKPPFSGSTTATLSLCMIYTVPPARLKAGSPMLSKSSLSCPVLTLGVSGERSHHGEVWVLEGSGIWDTICFGCGQDKSHWPQLNLVLILFPKTEKLSGLSLVFSDYNINMG